MMPFETLYTCLWGVLVLVIIGGAYALGDATGERRGAEDTRRGIVAFFKRAAAAQQFGDKGPLPRRVGLTPLHLRELALYLEDEEDRVWRPQEGERDARPSSLPDGYPPWGGAGGAAA